MQTQRRQLAADSTTLICCQRSGIAWQNAWTADAGFGRKRSPTTLSTPDVPSDTKPSPGWVAPMPSALVALSPPPPATTTDSARPSARATSARSVPDGALPSTILGICARVMPPAASSAPDQSRRAASSHSVPAASDGSDTFSPVSFRRR
ncbi:hypothetical protein DP43_1186 [Burkholderia pseudomallei]|nr:hypothetical protein DP43_1186 [Burkholderia pseudomallei]